MEDLGRVTSCHCGSLAGHDACCRQGEAESGAAKGGSVVGSDLSTVRFDDRSGNA